MARRAVRDTYGTERVGDVDVRRQIKAGASVPDHYKVKDGDVEDVERTVNLPGYRDGQATKRLRVSADETEVLDFDPGKVNRVHTDADRPQSEAEKEVENQLDVGREATGGPAPENEGKGESGTGSGPARKRQTARKPSPESKDD